MKREWGATTPDYAFDTIDKPNRPVPPPGEGWRLVSAVVATGVRVIWYWEREVEE